MQAADHEAVAQREGHAAVDQAAPPREIARPASLDAGPLGDQHPSLGQIEAQLRGLGVEQRDVDRDALADGGTDLGRDRPR